MDLPGAWTNATILIWATPRGLTHQERQLIGKVTCARSPLVTEPAAGLAGAVPPSGYSQATTGPFASSAP